METNEKIEKIYFAVYNQQLTLWKTRNADHVATAAPLPPVLVTTRPPIFVACRFRGDVCRFVLARAAQALYDAFERRIPMNHGVAAKAYKGLGMEGFTAKWYASLTRKAMDDFRALAHRVAAQIPPGPRCSK